MAKAKSVEAPAIVSPKVKTVRLSDMSPKEREVFATPAGFAQAFLGISLYPKQIKILNSFLKPHARVTTKTCNESGKTSVCIAPLILWHMTAFPFGMTVSTSGSWLQVTHQLVPRLQQFSHKFPKHTFNQMDILRGKRAVWTGFSTNQPGRAEGFHGDKEREGPLMALADEAKTIPDTIFQAFDDRVNPDRYGMFSSPGWAEGEFYRSFNQSAGVYTDHFSITAEECPHITKESIERRIKKYGINHPLVRSMIFAEFMELVEAALLSSSDVINCWANPPKRIGTERVCAIDWGGGVAENVVAFRQGNKVDIVDAWVEGNTHAAVGKVMRILKELQRSTGLRPEESWGDADGMGKPLNDHIRALGWNINDFHGGLEAVDQHHVNRITELWHTGAAKIKERKFIIPEDADLQSQMCNRKQVPASKGRLAIESKDDMRDRGVDSPDRADAVFVAMGDWPRYQYKDAIHRDKLSWDFPEQEEIEVDASVLEGMQA